MWSFTARTPPKYTLAQCAHVLSAVRPDSPGGWAMRDEELLGPADEIGSCSLIFVLPYQPYNSYWNDGP